MSEFTDSLRLHYDERLYEEADNLLCDAANYIDKVEAELATLKQELQALRDQKPVAWQLIDHKNYLPQYTIYPNKPPSYFSRQLYASPVPAREGWKLVPIEPTEEMLDNGRKYFKDNYLDIFNSKDHYKAMLEAAPKEQS